MSITAEPSTTSVAKEGTGARAAPAARSARWRVTLPDEYITRFASFRFPKASPPGATPSVFSDQFSA